jgi:hypothetical protein
MEDFVRVANKGFRKGKERKQRDTEGKKGHEERMAGGYHGP